MDQYSKYSTRCAAPYGEFSLAYARLFETCSYWLSWNGNAMRQRALALFVISRGGTRPRNTQKRTVTGGRRTRRRSKSPAPEIEMAAYSLLL